MTLLYPGINTANLQIEPGVHAYPRTPSNTIFVLDAITTVDATTLGLKVGDVVQAKGYATVNDDGGGSLLVTNSGTEDFVTQFDIGNGLFLQRLNLDTLTLPMGGADNTGTTECTAAIQRVIDASGTLQIPIVAEGEYKVTKQDTWAALQMKTNAKMTGTARFFAAEAFEGAMLMFGNPTDGQIADASIEGLDIDGDDIVSSYSVSGVSEVTAGVYFYNANDCAVTRCKVHHFLSDGIGTENYSKHTQIAWNEVHDIGIALGTQNGINADGEDYAVVEDNEVYNVRSAGRGIRVHSLDNGSIKRNVLHDNTAVAIGVDARNTAIEDNIIFDNDADAIWLLESSPFPTDNVSIKGNQIYANGYRGITQITPGNLATENVIKDNFIENCSVGITIDRKQYVRENRITMTATAQAILATGDGYVVEDNDAFGGRYQFFDSENATIKNNRQHAANTLYAYWVRGLVNSEISGNVSNDPLTIGFQFGVAGLVNCTGNRIIGNSVNELTTTPTHGFIDDAAQAGNLWIGNTTSGTFSTAAASVVGLGNNYAANSWQAAFLGDFAWASRPSASAVAVGSKIKITDYGYSEWYTDGTYWRPVNGQIVLAERSGSVASPIGTVTGVTAGQFTLSPTMLIPAGMLAYGSAQIIVDAQYYRRGATATATASARFGTANTVSDSAMAGITMTAVDTQSLRLQWCGYVTSADSITVQTSTPVNTASVAGALVDRSTNINGAAAQYASLHIGSANVADSFDLIGYRLTLIQ